MCEIIKRLEPQLSTGTAELIVVLNDAELTLPLTTAPNVRWCRETRYASPYAARNRGITEARGRLIALLDASCIPSPDWLVQGIAALDAGHDLAAGRVVFRFEGATPTAAERWDAVIHVQQEQAVRRGCAKTANLFITRHAIEQIGPFRSACRSGEDVRWTSAATTAGLSLTFASRACVEKRARPLPALLRKAARVGAGQAQRYSAPATIARAVALFCIPPKPSALRQAIRIAPRTGWWSLLPRLILVGWAVHWMQALGLLAPRWLRHAD